MKLFDGDRFVGPFVYGTQFTLNLETLKREYTLDPDKVAPIRFFCRGDEYRFWGLFDANLHLFCPAKEQELFLLGTDRLGRNISMIRRVRLSTQPP